jgi:hypothetical protein
MQFEHSFKKTNCSGYLLVLVLVFGSLFFIVVSSFVGYVVTQNQLVNFRYEQQRATDIAEAGLNYYKWYLAHYPGDVTNGTGLPGPYVHQYKDPEGSFIGEFSLDVASSTYCGEITAIDVSSTAHTYANPDAQATVRGRYARPSVASYYSITNTNVWYSSAGTVNGPIHSNQGVRMDKAHNSVVSSGLTDWSCGSAFGCSPTTTVDGVYTTSALSNPALFSFPAAPIDFGGVTLDLTNLQDKAQNDGGLYFGPSTKQGYHLIFKPGNIVEVRRVNSKENEPPGYAWGLYMNILKGTSLVGNYAINPSCPVIFVEDQVWIEGEINGKVTIAAADVDTVGEDPSVIINNNLTYGSPDSGLLVVAEYDVLIGLTVPDDMILNGIFVAQTGKFGRNFYDTSMPNSWEEYILRNSLTVNGSIISANQPGYNYTASGVLTSGFDTVTSSYDINQVYDPPPFTPYTSDVYSFFNWRQDG